MLLSALSIQRKAREVQKVAEEEVKRGKEVNESGAAHI